MRVGVGAEIGGIQRGKGSEYENDDEKQCKKKMREIADRDKNNRTQRFFFHLSFTNQNKPLSAAHFCSHAHPRHIHTQPITHTNPSRRPYHASWPRATHRPTAGVRGTHSPRPSNPWRRRNAAQPISDRPRPQIDAPGAERDEREREKETKKQGGNKRRTKKLH